MGSSVSVVAPIVAPVASPHTDRAKATEILLTMLRSFTLADVMMIDKSLSMKICRNINDASLIDKLKQGYLAPWPRGTIITAKDIQEWDTESGRLLRDAVNKMIE